MGVFGRYVETFAEASHCVFDGHADDPFYRAIAIQRIKSVSPTEVVLEESGTLRIGKHRKTKKECVGIRYRGFFGYESTYGYPFKDSNTPVPATTG